MVRGNVVVLLVVVGGCVVTANKFRLLVNNSDLNHQRHSKLLASLSSMLFKPFNNVSLFYDFSPIKLLKVFKNLSLKALINHKALHHEITGHQLLGG